MRLVMDLDETLIINDFLSKPSRLPAVNCSSADYFSDIVRVRPYATAFLREAGKWFSSVYLATMSSRSRALRVLQETRLARFFDGCFCREDLGIGSPPADLPPESFVLIDDQDIESCIVQPKLYKFGAFSRRKQASCFVQIPQFSGDTTDGSFCELLRALRCTGDVRKVIFKNIGESSESVAV